MKFFKKYSITGHPKFQEEKRLSTRSSEAERIAVEAALSIDDPGTQIQKILLEVWDEDVIVV